MKDFKVYKDGELYWEGKANWKGHALQKAKIVFFDAQVEDETRPEYEIENILSSLWEAHCEEKVIIRKPRIKRRARK